MTDEETHAVVIEIPKGRKYNEPIKQQMTKSFSKKVMKTRQQQQQQTNKHYGKVFSLPNITALKPLPVKTCQKEEILLPYLRYSKKQAKDRFNERLKIRPAEDFRIAYTDLQQRLHIDDPVDDTRGITDYDPTFFMCVRSTLLSSYVPPYKSLKYLLNSQLGWRLEIGYRRDTVLNIDVNHINELQIYDATVKRYFRQIKYFNDFISFDYKNSISFLSKWEELKSAIAKKELELQGLASEIFTTTSKIVGLNYRYELQQKYGRFLYYLSPPSWRLKHRNFARSIEIEAKGFDFGISSEEDTFHVIMEKLKKECDSGLVKPVLYFQQPNDLLEIFDNVEQQHLHHFTHVTRLASHASYLKKGIKLFKDIIAQDSYGLFSVIKEFEKMLIFNEDQCSQLEGKFFKILNTSFYNSVAAPEVLKFQLHLEFCYSKVYNEKPMNLGMVGTAKALEDFYMDYSERLESVTSKDISFAIKEIVISERKKLRRAKIAAKELRLFERLVRGLHRTYAPAKSGQHQASSTYQPSLPNIKHPPYKQPSKLETVRKSLINDNQTGLTEAEMEYLTLFTDWTEDKDPAHYLRSLSVDNKK